jgi:aminopeptidase-like protein
MTGTHFTINELIGSLDMDQAGEEMYRLLMELYPICRSITGDGIRETLGVIGRHLALRMHEVASGTAVFDWTVPKEWNIRDAYIKNSKGERVVDFRKSNLHVMSYSVPVRRRMRLDELKSHLFSLPEYTEWVPYRTSYYKEDWGFCLSHRQLLELEEDDYEVYIDSSLTDGHLTYGEFFVPGETEDEVLVSVHACHPSLCDDNLSGIAVATFLAKYLRGVSLRYSYRFIFIPGTIGSITWLSLNESILPRIRHGIVLTCVGDASGFTYKRSRRGDAPIDRAFEHVLKHSDKECEVIDFFPYGYDERQYCSPAFNLPIGSLMRMRHGQLPQYHTSADDPEFVSPEQMAEALAICLSAFSVVENNGKYVNQSPKCEPRLGKHGLYTAVGGQTHRRQREMALLWTLNLSDGLHSLLEIAERAGLPFSVIEAAAEALCEVGLLKPSDAANGHETCLRDLVQVEVQT